MHVTAHLDVDVIAVETADEVSVLVELTAPTAPPPAPDALRPQRTLQIVLDRSGSMGGDRLDGAKRALAALVDRLEPTDNFGVVAFDDKVELPVPAGLLTDKAAVKRAIANVTAGGSTDLSGGYLRGIQEARRVAGQSGATILLVSDGHANAGVKDPHRLAGIATEAREHGLTTTALGWGQGYDERIMAAIAQGGSGNELYAEDSDTAVGLIAAEVEGLLSQTAQAASLLIRMSQHVVSVSVVNELTTTATKDGVLAELGSFYSGESRRILLTFAVPGVAALGLMEIATLELTYVELPELKQHTVSLPLHVNVVPGDQAAGRVRDPEIHTEVVYQQVQKAKRSASAKLSAGQHDEALQEIRAAQDLVAQQLAAGASERHVADLTEEARMLENLARWTEQGHYSHSSKTMSMDSTYKSRYRGRSNPKQP